MKISAVSVVPVELYTSGRKDMCENRLKKDGLIRARPGKIKDIFSEIAGESAAVYEIAPDARPPEFSALVAFENSSACFCIERELSGWTADHASICAELENRKKFHHAIIGGGENGPLRRILREMNEAAPAASYGAAAPCYAFSFYVIQKEKGEAADAGELMKLAEPSAINMDDMLSAAGDAPPPRAGMKPSVLRNIKDADISAASETYVSWAAVVSITDEENFGKTKNLLAALEIRLQIIWNRCYSVSRYIEKVFDGEAKTDDVSELFWSFSRMLNDANSVLSSTLSSRADKIFKEMVETSKVGGEIARLEQKVSLLEKYIGQQNAAGNRKYQKTIELMLFITAIASLTAVFFPLPVPAPSWLGAAVIAAVAVLGIYAIFKSK